MMETNSEQVVGAWGRYEYGNSTEQGRETPRALRIGSGGLGWLLLGHKEQIISSLVLGGSDGYRLERWKHGIAMLQPDICGPEGKKVNFASFPPGNPKQICSQVVAIEGLYCHHTFLLASLTLYPPWSWLHI